MALTMIPMKKQTRGWSCLGLLFGTSPALWAEIQIEHKFRGRNENLNLKLAGNTLSSECYLQRN